LSLQINPVDLILRLYNFEQVTVMLPNIVSASLSISSASVSANGVDLSPIASVGLSVCPESVL